MKKYVKNTYRLNEVDSRFIQNIIENGCALHLCESRASALTFSSRIRGILHHIDSRIGSGVKISVKDEYVVAWLFEVYPFKQLNEIVMVGCRDKDSITAYSMDIAGVKEILKNAISKTISVTDTPHTLRTIEEMKEYIRSKFKED